MGVTAWTALLVGASFLLYIVIAIRSRASSTREFYIAGQHVPPLANGMATAADWMSAASFISMAGIISFSGYDGSVYLMGWTGGYVLLALLLAPYLRKFGKYTVPDFIGERYYSQTARLVAVVCAIFISFTYVSGQMRGVGVVFSRFLEVDVSIGVLIGMAVVFIYAVLGGMKGITYTQVAQYCVLIFAFMVPAIFISLHVAGTVIPQIGFGAIPSGSEVSLLARLDGLHEELGFSPYTSGTGNTLNMLASGTCRWFGRRLFQRRATGFEKFDEVPAVARLALGNPAGLFDGEGGSCKFRLDASAADPVEIAAENPRADIERVASGQGTEVGAALDGNHQRIGDGLAGE